MIPYRHMLTCLDCGSAATLEGKVRCGPCREVFMAEKDMGRAEHRRKVVEGMAKARATREGDAAWAYSEFMQAADRYAFMRERCKDPAGDVMVSRAASAADNALRYAVGAFRRDGMVVDVLGG